MEKFNSTVSVLIPTYNRAHYIEECLDSILDQTVRPLEVIVIDDGSEDKTAERLKKYRDRIVYLRKENEGKSKALNLVLNQAKGEYIWLFDDDDVALPDAIEKRLIKLAENPAIDVVYSAHFYGVDGVDGKIKVTDRYQLPDIKDSDFFFNVLCGCFFTLPSVLFHRRCLETVQLFDCNLLRSQDYDFVINLVRHNRCQGLNEPTYIVRRHEGVRGTKQDSHSAEHRESKWLTYDGMIGRKIRNDLQLNEYVPKADSHNLKLIYMRRMAVMASKGLVEEMLEDLKAALKINDQKLTEQEKKLCRESVCQAYFVMQLLNNRERSEIFFSLLRLVLDGSNQKKQILFEYLRAFFWLFRQPEQSFKARYRLLTFMSITLGI